MTAPHKTEAGAKPEFSRIVAADDIGAGETTIEIEANAGERAALARRFDLLAIDGLRARAIIRRGMARDGSGMALNVAFRLGADVVQRCVVSLEPVPAQIHQAELSVDYRPGADPDPAIEVDVVPEGIDPPEILVDGRFDLGELVAEHLALALDPYPRAEDTASQSAEPSSESGPEAGDEHPFAALRGWSKRASSNRD